MAYDQSNSYEAPRRAYYDQHQQAPVQRQNGGYPPQQQQQQQQYDGYDRSYDQGYGQPNQQHGGYDDYGYDMNQQPGHYYGDGGGTGNAYGQEQQYGQGYPQQDYGQQDYTQGGHPQQPNGHGRPNEGYTNGHQDAHGSQDRQYDPRSQQRPRGGGPPQQSNGHGYPQESYAGQAFEDHGSQDRQYDPRYQQRPGRGGHPPSNGSRSQRPPPSSDQDYRGHPPQSRGQPPQPRGHDPRNGYPQQRPGHQAQGPERIQQDPRNGNGERKGVQDGRDRPDKRPAPPQSNGGSRQAMPPPEEPKKSAMEEWKAKEKARLHEDANKPKMIPQDNPFPTVASKQKDGKNTGGHEGQSSRSSEDHARPSTSGGRNGSRPGSSRDNSHQQMSPPPGVNGQSQHHSHSNRAPQQFAPIHEQPVQQHPAQYADQRGVYGREQPPQSQRQTNATSRRPVPPRNDTAPQRYDQSNPATNDRMPPRTQSAGVQQSHDRGPPNGRERVVPPPQAQVPYVRPQSQPPPQPAVAPIAEPARPNVPEPPAEDTPTVDPNEFYPQESWRTGPPRKRPQNDRPPKPEPEVAPPQESWRTGPAATRAQDQVTARQPEVVQPPVIPPAMSPPQATLPVMHQAPARVLSPPLQQPRSGFQPPHAATPKNFARPHAAPVAPAREESLDDLYDDYYGEEQPQAVSVPAPPQNRDEEIEAEMPDFDSAAPGQTSGVQKRQQTADRHPNNAPAQAPSQRPMMPPQNNSVQSLPVHAHHPYDHYQENPVASQPELRDVRHDQGGSADGFVFGVPGEQARPQQHYDDPRQMQPRQQQMAYRPVQSVPPENMGRFQAPVDQRQVNMPMHGGPPGDHSQGPRFHQGGRGPLPPQQRSASTRPPIAQTGWSDPGLQRAPTAPPPMRQDSYGAPHHGPPRTASLTNQQHRAPSAPPGQQHMRGMPPPGGPRNAPPFGQQQPMRPPPQDQRPSDPDALPHHPAPYRPGLNEQGAPQPSKAAPARNYDNRSSTSSHQRQVSISEGPITKADLEQARLDMEANKASPRLNLRYAKKLVEASHVLASEGGRLDAKATQRNREKWLNEAYKRVKELVRNTYPEAQFYMAECYGSGELGLQVDPKEAFSLYQAAAKGGHAAAAFRTAVSCEIGPEEGGGTRKDYPKAVQWYRRAAALGDVAAMYKLGIVLLRGLLGVPRNVGEAVSWLKRAAERADKDNPHALHELATLHEPTNADAQVREKIFPDSPYALSLYKQAAEYGFKRSQFRLGQAYEYGSLGLEIDNRASIAWYTKAAAQGEHNAELALSGWYLTGAEGMLEQSDMEAYLWARKAAASEPPLAKAMFAMGYFTEQGIGCPKSLEEAKRWYGRAASFQFPRALERLEELKKGGKNKSMQNGKLTRDKKKDDENCVVM